MLSPRKPPPPNPKKKAPEPPPQEPQLQVMLRCAEVMPQPVGAPGSIVPTAAELAAAKAEAEEKAVKEQLKTVAAPKHMTTSQLRKALKFAQVETSGEDGEPLARLALEALYQEHCSEEAIARRESAAQPSKVIEPRAEWILALYDAEKESTALIEWFRAEAVTGCPHARSSLCFDALSEEECNRVYREAHAHGLRTMTAAPPARGIEVHGVEAGSGRNDLTPAEGAEQAPLFALLGWLGAAQGGILSVEELVARLKRRPASELPSPYAGLVDKAVRLQHTVAGFGCRSPTMPPPAVGAEEVRGLEEAFLRRVSIAP